MTNEYGARLDANGYAPSILHDEDACYICLSPETVRHEVFEGSGRRAKSKRLGLWLPLCPGHHMEMHDRAEKALALKQTAQRRAMEHYGWSKEDFILSLIHISEPTRH